MNVLKIYGGHFDPDKKIVRIKELEDKMLEPNFWDDKRSSEKVIHELNSLKDSLERVSILKNKIDTNLVLATDLKNNEDVEVKELVELEIAEINEELESLETQILLDGKFDSMGAILEVHSGAGGTEACDWAEMLYRMYERFCNNHGYKLEVIDTQYGEEAGIKSLTMLVQGMYAYGYLKAEKGVHRLVRISPFDSNARRHTSFASIDITPLFEQTDVDVEIKDSDIRIDVYRSSGCGGQGVNTTDSAVRITHFPTGIVVTCQNERSQIQNKERAMEVLKNKIYQLELEKRDSALKEIKGGVMDINFGSQIRSYVMHPYSMVKDHRTNVETSNVSKVLDGDLDMFINAYLKGKV